MNTYPTYTVGTIFVVGIVQSILVWLALSSAVGKLGSTPVFRNLTRIGFAVCFATWFGLIFSLSGSDTFFALRQPGGRERALFALFMPSVVGLLLLRSATVRDVLASGGPHRIHRSRPPKTVAYMGGICAQVASGKLRESAGCAPQVDTQIDTLASLPRPTSNPDLSILRAAPANISRFCCATNLVTCAKRTTLMPTASSRPLSCGCGPSSGWTRKRRNVPHPGGRS